MQRLRCQQAFREGLRLMDFFDIRVFFKKVGDAKYISHLDLSRFMQRSLKRTGLPLWHTEGFNPHPYVTFALPLSVGQSGQRETMDFRLTSPVSHGTIKQRLAECMPKNIVITDVKTPVFKAKEIESAVYNLELFECADIFGKIKSFFLEDSIIAEKKTKKGDTRKIDLAPDIFDLSLFQTADGVRINMRLPTGSEHNINPSLVIKALEKYCDREFCPVHIDRTAVKTRDGKDFE